MMLASTVQFSKYGRYRHLDRRVPRFRACWISPARSARDPGPFGEKPVQSKGGQDTSVPSGPNSVLGQAVPSVSLPSCEAGVLTDVG
jgi:hypothetical protein